MKLPALILAIVVCMAAGPAPRLEVFPASQVSAPAEATARYVFADGGFSLNINRSTRRTSSVAFPTDGPRTAEGKLIIDSVSYEYGDCSSATLICADFEEFVLSVPRSPSEADSWSYQSWHFKRTACLSTEEQRCTRFVAVFRNEAADSEGRLLFSYTRGVEMHFNSRISRGERRQIYVLATEVGLHHAGRP